MTDFAFGGDAGFDFGGHDSGIGSGLDFGTHDSGIDFGFDSFGTHDSGLGLDFNDTGHLFGPAPAADTGGINDLFGPINYDPHPLIGPVDPSVLHQPVMNPDQPLFGPPNEDITMNHPFGPVMNPDHVHDMVNNTNHLLEYDHHADCDHTYPADHDPWQNLVCNEAETNGFMDETRQCLIDETHQGVGVVERHLDCWGDALESAFD